jgi:hypothetical protein
MATGENQEAKEGKLLFHWAGGSPAPKGASHAFHVGSGPKEVLSRALPVLNTSGFEIQENSGP